MLNRQFPCNSLRSFKVHDKAFQFTLFAMIIFFCGGCGGNGSGSNNNIVDIAQGGTTSTVLEIQSISTQVYEPESPLDLPPPTPTPVPTPTAKPLSEMTVEERDAYLWNRYDQTMVEVEAHAEDLLERGDRYDENDGTIPPSWRNLPEEVIEQRWDDEREDLVEMGFALAGELEYLPDLPRAFMRFHPEIIHALKSSSDSVSDGVAAHATTEDLYYLVQLYNAIEGGYIVYDESSEDTYYEVQEYIAGNLQKISSGGLTIIKVNKVDEYVIIENSGEEAVDLIGWILLSERGAQAWTVPSSFVLNPSEQVTIYAGVGQSDTNVMYSGFNSNIWNNDEPDSAVLLSPDGTEVSRQ